MLNLKYLSKLGGGTYGKVYEVQLNNGDKIAIKRLMVPKVYSGSVASIRELDILNAVKGHPFCIQLIDSYFGVLFPDENLSPDPKDELTDQVYFLLEKGQMDGLSYIKNKQANWVDRKLMAVQVALGIEFLHSRGIYHRDIKPGNIICFLDDSRLVSAKLTDFGLADYYTFQAISPSEMVTLWYRAPEIILKKEYDYSVDVWSFGCLLYEIFFQTNLTRGDTEGEVLNRLASYLEFPQEDLILAKRLFGRSFSSKSRSKPLINQMKMSDYQIAAFNSSMIGGRVNSGTFNQLIELINGCLTWDPNNRYRISQCLNSEFFQGHRGLIHQVRAKFGINSDGNWIFQPPVSLDYIPENPVRKIGIKWILDVYQNRDSYPISFWYSNRILFHTIEMFDRMIRLTQVSSAAEGDVLIWVNSLFFISAKFFRIMQYQAGIDMFAFGVRPEDFDIFRNRALQFEQYLIRNVFKGNIYQPTLYESANEFMNEEMVENLIKVILSDKILPGTSAQTIWYQVGLSSVKDSWNEKIFPEVKL